MSGSLHTTGARPGRSMHAVVSPTSRCFPAQSHLKTLRHQPGHLARVRHLLPRALSADSPVSPDKEEADPVSVSIDNDTSTEYTIVTVQGANKAGLLMSVSGLFRDLGIDVTKAQVETTNGLVNDQFYVTDSSTGGKVTSEEDIAMLSSVLRNLASNRPGRALSRTEFENITARKKAVINNLMGALPAPQQLAAASPGRSPAPRVAGGTSASVCWLGGVPGTPPGPPAHWTHEAYSETCC